LGSSVRPNQYHTGSGSTERANLETNLASNARKKIPMMVLKEQIRYKNWDKTRNQTQDLISDEAWSQVLSEVSLQIDVQVWDIHDLISDQVLDYMQENYNEIS
jgi:hypothetical protein